MQREQVCHLGKYHKHVQQTNLFFVVVAERLEQLATERVKFRRAGVQLAQLAKVRCSHCIIYIHASSQPLVAQLGGTVSCLSIKY